VGAPLFTGTFGTLKARQHSHPLAALLDLQVGLTGCFGGAAGL
jgi:hypothetical protein